MIHAQNRWPEIKSQKILIRDHKSLIDNQKSLVDYPKSSIKNHESLVNDQNYWATINSFHIIIKSSIQVKSLVNDDESWVNYENYWSLSYDRKTHWSIIKNINQASKSLIDNRKSFIENKNDTVSVKTTGPIHFPLEKFEFSIPLS